MSQENVELIRRGFELFNEGKFDVVLREIFHPEIEMTVGIGPLLGIETIRGREAVRRFWVEELPEGLDEFSIDPLGLEDFGEVVLANVRYRARGPASRMEIEQQFASIYSFRNGLVHRIHDHPTRAQALEAAAALRE
jgi:ketosteroid isomerase-like protein